MARGWQKTRRSACATSRERRRNTAVFVALLVLPMAFDAASGCSAASASSPFGVGSGDGGNAPALDGSVSGGDSAVGIFDAGSNVDAGQVASGDSGNTLGPTSLLVVHASANVYPFRLCFGGPVVQTPEGKFASSLLPLPAYPNDPSQPMPDTNYAGVPVGGAATTPSIPLAGGVFTVYVLRALKFDATTNQETCDELLCTEANASTGCLPYGSYATTPPVAFPGGPALLAIEGCMPLANAPFPGSVAQCGATYDDTFGNVSAFVSPLGAVASEDGGGSLVVQTALLSPSFDEMASADGGVAAFSYVDLTDDASVPLSLPDGADGGLLGTSALSLGDGGAWSGAFVVSSSSGNAVTEGLSTIQYFQAPSSEPVSYFGQDVAYFTAVVGDATDAAAPLYLSDGGANPAFDGYGLHVISYPEPASP